MRIYACTKSVACVESSSACLRVTPYFPGVPGNFDDFVMMTPLTEALVA